MNQCWQQHNMANKRILLATYPFGAAGKEPLELLGQTGWELICNPYQRRLGPHDITDLLADIDGVIAGTEPYDCETLCNANRLQVISRVGIGLDSVDMKYCRDANIQVTYTPDAPAQAVAELTVANILNLCRHIHRSHRSVCEGAWNRFMGRLVQETTIAIIGVGRIGSRVIRLLEPFRPTILANDIDPKVYGKPMPNTKWCPTEDIIRTADVITLHIPLCAENHHFIDRSLIARMKTGAFLINTSRGAVVDTEALTDALLQNHLGGAALDVYENEPYEGPLTKLDNVVLTAHIAASAQQSRYLMELGAAEDCIRVLNGEQPNNDALNDMFGSSRMIRP
jgi:D-3-phosphoglycerate dehydrogenase